MRRSATAWMLIAGLSSPLAAYDDSGHLSREVVCISGGDDVLMEIYLPNAVVFHGAPMDDSRKPVAGFFVLDLEKLGKGRSMEPVKVWRDAKANVLKVDRFSRGLPLVSVPIDGGIVDFDNRFGEGARCKPYGFTREDDQAVEFPPAAPVPAEDAGAAPEAK